MVLIAIMVWLRDLTFYDNAALAVTIIASLVVVLASEVWGIMTTKAMYVG